MSGARHRVICTSLAQQRGPSSAGKAWVELGLKFAGEDVSWDFLLLEYEGESQSIHFAPQEWREVTTQMSCIAQPQPAVPCDLDLICAYNVYVTVYYWEKVR
jgi:hypothetical protein